MHQDVVADFTALSPRAKMAVLSRAVHMETIQIRSGHLDHPDVAERIYLSSEFIHLHSGFIVALPYESEEFQRDATYAAISLIEGIEPCGEHNLRLLHQRITEVRPIS